MTRPGIYAFEEIDEVLSTMPLAARRVLAGLGRALTPEGWRSLVEADRRRIALAGAGEHVDEGVLPLVDDATPPPRAVIREPEGGSPSPSTRLIAMLGPGRPLDEARWRRLTALDRYALMQCATKPDILARAYDEVVGSGLPLTHLTGAGEVHMVDVGRKSETARRAVAGACVRTTTAVVRAVEAGSVIKGDVLAVARVAGILASKRTPELIPLCHPVRTSHTEVEIQLDALAGEIRVRSIVEAIDRTGVEMEAMVAASVAALTVYDMVKSADRWASIDGVRLEAKSGGKSGDVTRPGERS